MRVSARPSKAFLFSMLKSELKKINGEVGVDAAPANFKNYPLFETKRYVGIDISPKLLSDGKAKHPEGIAVLHDLSVTELPYGSIDVVVSTNTLQQIPPEPRLKAIKNFCNWVSPKGVLLMEMDQENLSQDVSNLIDSYFEQVEILYYQNGLSKWFESFLERDGRVIIDHYPKVVKRIVYTVSKIISISEYLTCGNKKNKKHIFIKCTDKKNGERNKFSLSSYKKSDDGFYYIK